jgi:rare lipoprotein A (peptidoglycan hydrolase)
MWSRGRVLVSLALSVSVAAAAMQPAAATDLDDLRARAQLVADRVTELEHRLADLRSRQSNLDARVTEATQRLALLELQIGDTRAAYDAALDVYVERAVQLYKQGPTSRMELLLSARDLNELYTLSHAANRAAELHVDSLESLLAAKEETERAQVLVDAKKQRLLHLKLQADRILDETQDRLAERRSALTELTAEIKRLEAEARRQAALAAQPSQALGRLLDGSGPSQGIPRQFIGTGVTFEGVASWYGPGFEGNPTASGQIFDPNLYTAASLDLPLGTWLYVEHQGRGVVVLVNDRGPYIDGRILDLSKAAAFVIGITGLGWIEAELLIER